MNRRLFLSCAPVAAATLAGCGSGGGSDSPSPSPSPGNPSPAPAPGPGSAPSPGNPWTPSGPIPTLTLHSGAQSGNLPYQAAVYPLEGAVPNGQGLVSPDDASLRSSVLSRWPDGSAAVVVVCGETTVNANSTQQIRLAAGAAGSSPLSTTLITQLLPSGVTVNCGALGVASLTVGLLSSPAKVWWANERVICARYRVPVVRGLEAVIDVHAFSGGRAFVEVVIENCKMNTTSPQAPSTESYGATVAVNGTTVATLNSSTHRAFRAWYASGWVGGDPQVEVTHEAAAMQSHPLLFRLWKQGVSMAGYANDTYTPFGVGRQPPSNMGGTGDAPSIGPLPLWEAQYLQTGAKEARRAVLASATSVLTFNVNYRDSTSGWVPDFAALGDRNRQQNGSDPSRSWPVDGVEPAWELAHHPAAGLMAFMCRPSPCFIEIAQKIAVWNHTSEMITPGTTYGGVRWTTQIRGKAWAIRSLAHALFLTPDGEAWKAPAREVLHNRARSIQRYKDDSKARLNFTWDYEIDSVFDHHGLNGFQQAMWEHHYLLVELHKAAAAKLLTGSQQATLNDVANWAAAQPVRYINEAAGGAWRLNYYKMTLGRNASTIDSLPTYGEQLAWQYTDSPPALSGPWMMSSESATTYASATVYNGTGTGAYYPEYFWAALVAAVERGVPGADTAWTTVTTNVTNLATWSNVFGGAPRWGIFPRNKTLI